MVIEGTTWTIKPEEIPQSVFEEAFKEADYIWESHYTDKESLSGRIRDKSDIRSDCLLGKLGEYFLMSEFGYVNDDEKWHDLISQQGERTEVKTMRKDRTSQYKIDQIITKLRNRKRDRRKWFFSTKAIVLLYENDVFEIHKTYDI